MSKHSFKGLGVALVTPFTETNKVDYKSLERLVEHLVRDRATDFLVVHGTTGESPCLTRQERDAVTEQIVKQVAGRCPIMVGLGGNNTLETADRIAAMMGFSLWCLTTISLHRRAFTSTSRHLHVGAVCPLCFIMCQVEWG